MYYLNIIKTRNKTQQRVFLKYFQYQFKFDKYIGFFLIHFVLSLISQNIESIFPYATAKLGWYTGRRLNTSREFL